MSTHTISHNRAKHGEETQLLAGGRIPLPDQVVAAAGIHLAAVGREGHRPDFVELALEAPHLDGRPARDGVAVEAQQPRAAVGVDRHLHRRRRAEDRGRRRGTVPIIRRSSSVVRQGGQLAAKDAPPGILDAFAQRDQPRA